MEVGGLESAVRALQVAVASLSREEERARELGALLEQRVRILEQGSRGEPVPEKRASSAPAPAPEPPMPVAPETLAANADKGREAEGGADELEYSIGESLWDAPLVIGLPGMSWGSSALLFLSLVMNATVQVFLCLAIITSEDFVHPNRYKDLEGPMRRWRFTSAHDNSMVDAKHTSLVSRVCGGDLSLSVANKQADLLVEINSYLALDDTAVERRSFGPGPLLCVVCIFLFAVVVARELRCLAVSAGAALSVRRGATAVEEGRLAALSSCRLACFLAAGLVRVGIALALALAGTMWLSTTTSTTDLILNAAALGFILDLDECLYETTVPTDVHAFVRGLGTLRYRRSRWRLDALAPLVAIGLMAGLSVPLLIEPNVSSMMVVKRALCGGSLDFATARNPAGYIVTTTTDAFDPADGPESLDLQERANMEQAFGAGAQFSMLIPFPSYFELYSAETLEDLSMEGGPCLDKDGAGAAGQPHVVAAVRFQANIHRGEAAGDRPFRCSDYAAACQESGLLRHECPKTCGCDDLASGLFLSAPAQGCPARCEMARAQRLEERNNQTCADAAVVGTRQWTAYWMKFEDLMLGISAQSPGKMDFFRGFAARKRARGCNNTERDPYFNIDFCRSGEYPTSTNGWSSILSFCPATCCGGSDPPPECPPACRAAPRQAPAPQRSPPGAP